ncbi:C45 family autoproteolytic acyltransferase/hydolase [Leucothrix arctica]|uniref:Uncharacterized protein n=1 Tax=Leucothrix arctica TaxID=1481894 RepID=A0A317CET8_9GAMM|nr:C45 family autoproteolytic acyltransferase/hydolase [Leucothrix arctica]PWQ97164.1 hypothetical protein DKT75_07565 [Leucothrix arctica]
MYKTLLAPLVILGSLLISTLAAAESQKLPIIYIDATTLSAKQTGLEVGRQSKRLFPNIERRYDIHLKSTLSQSTFNDIVQHHLPTLLQTLDRQYKEEINGISGAWQLVTNNKLGDGKLSLDEFKVLNLLPDLGYPPMGSGFGVFGRSAENRQTLVGRNLDMSSTPQLRSLQAITVYYYKNDNVVVNIGFAGILSVVTGYNNKGLFLSLLSARNMNPYKQFGENNIEHLHSSVFAIKKALTDKIDIKKANHILSGKHYSADFNFLIADKEKVEVLESSSSEHISKLRKWDSDTFQDSTSDSSQQISVVNCFALRVLPNNCYDPNNIVRLSRFHELTKFNIKNPATLEKLSLVMLDSNKYLYEIFNTKTLQSVIYKPSNNSLYLYASSINNEKKQPPEYKVYLDIIKKKSTNFSLLSLIEKWFNWILLFFMISIIAVFGKKNKEQNI